MLRRIIALTALVVIGIGACGDANAAAPRWGGGGNHHGGGGHWHGGGGHWHGGGGYWRGGGWGWGWPAAVGFGIGYGAAGYYGAYGYPYYAGYAYGGCYRTVRVGTPYGWRLRRVWICR